MGSGRWDSEKYKTETTTRRATGTADFGHHEEVRAGRASGVHPDLDPKKVAGPTSPLAGQNVRESRDSEEHPNSFPVVVFFDVTGSMQRVPRVLQSKLPKLMDVIIEKGGVNDPQILVGAVGDATSDQYPFQVGQFESDNRFDEQLRQMVLEGGGGAYGQESYDLVFYAAARKFVLDSFEKRGKKGFLFLIADERPRDFVNVLEVNEIFGDQIEKNIPIADIIAEAREKFEIYLIVPTEIDFPAHHRARWNELLDSQHILNLEDANLVCETIAGFISIAEGGRDLVKIVGDLGLSDKDGEAVTNALAPIAKSRMPVHVATGVVPDGVGTDASGVTRL